MPKKRFVVESAPGLARQINSQTVEAYTKGEARASLKRWLAIRFGRRVSRLPIGTVIKEAK